ncbi:hypothetical protein [Methylomonas koyamae]|uniref:hypothetical protein n=1 Tax=Methylomonas koyamae TaxID=702114 RepID=UPI0012F6A703|nr:hypothetical protein [Methylomonas koyamae]
MGHGAAGVFDGGNRQPFREHLAVFAPVPNFALPGALALDAVPHLRVKIGVVYPRLQQLDLAADDLARLMQKIAVLRRSSMVLVNHNSFSMPFKTVMSS